MPRRTPNGVSKNAKISRLRLVESSVSRYAGQLERGLLAVEAELRAEPGAPGDTCGVAAVRGDADGCARDPAFAARLPEERLMAPLVDHLRRGGGEL